MTMTSAERNRRWRNGVTDPRGMARSLVAEQRRMERVSGMDKTWRERAACTSLPIPGRKGAKRRTDLFYSSPENQSRERRQGPSPAEVEALRICREVCPVMHACRDYAIETRETNGVWGGMLPAELARYRREVHVKGSRS